ncbi:WecB/TagA/CpsF family glycosyltransferase, partial [Bacteroidota bacterium]
EDMKIKLQKINFLHPDGIGIYWASKFLYGKNGFKERINGTDLYFQVLKSAMQNKWKVFLYGGGFDDSKITSQNIMKSFKGLKLTGIIPRFESIHEDVIKKINDSNSQILFVGLGSPSQENFLWHYSSQINIPVQIAVGSGIDYISGNYKRAPLVLRNIGLEWLYRLYREPKRLWKRYLIGIPVFVFKVFCLKVRLLLNKS